MRNNDDVLLEQLYQEGIWDRLKGQGAGIKQGAGTLMKNFGGKLTGDTGDRPSARAEYAKAQQGSLLKSFVQKVQKEIADFNNDLKLFKVDTNPDTLQKDFPIIAQRLEEIKNLEKFLTNPTQAATPVQSKKPEAQTSSSGEPTEAAKMTTNVQDYMDMKSAAEYLKISETELQNKAATGKIKSTIVGGKPLFKKQDLDNLNKPEEKPKTETPEQSKEDILPTPENTPNKGDTVKYGLFNYTFNGKVWEAVGKKGNEVIKNEDLIKKIYQAWQQQKSAKPAAKAVVKPTPKKTVTKTKSTATKKPTTKVAPKAKVKKPTTKTNVKAAPKKAAIKPRKVVNASYNPFGEFLKECNLL